jgi:hypothetical protein
MSQILFRILSGILIFLLVFVLPWWLSLAIIILAGFIFPLFFEFFLFSAILYVLFYRVTELPIALPLILAPLLFIGIEYTKKFLIFYRYE